jgi:hypothetical protein
VVVVLGDVPPAGNELGRVALRDRILVGCLLSKRGVVLLCFSCGIHLRFLLAHLVDELLAVVADHLIRRARPVADLALVLVLVTAVDVGLGFVLDVARIDVHVGAPEIGIG